MIVAGCGATAEPGAAPTPTSVGAEQKKEEQKKELNKAEQDSVKMENLIADCMKAQGFQYTAHPMSYPDPGDTGAVGDPTQASYDKLKQYRQKYGYAIYGRDVYPTDPAVGYTPSTPNPNNAIRDGLDQARRDAYDKALNGDFVKGGVKAGSKPPGANADSGCSGKASAEIYPPSDQQKKDPAKEAEYKQLVQAFQTDPEVLKAAKDYGDCLRRAGFQVPSTKPGVIESTVQQIVLKERSDKPEKIDAAAAQQGLQTEIQKSLTDLECGKDYLRLAKPHMEKILSSDGGNG
jgi:hypothetical protein